MSYKVPSSYPCPGILQVSVLYIYDALLGQAYFRTVRSMAVRAKLPRALPSMPWYYTSRVVCCALSMPRFVVVFRGQCAPLLPWLSCPYLRQVPRVFRNMPRLLLLYNIQDIYKFCSSLCPQFSRLKCFAARSNFACLLLLSLNALAMQ